MRHTVLIRLQPFNFLICMITFIRIVDDYQLLGTKIEHWFAKSKADSARLEINNALVISLSIQLSCFIV